MIRRPPRSTLSSSSAASDVYKRQVQRRPSQHVPRRRLRRCGAAASGPHQTGRGGGGEAMSAGGEAGPARIYVTDCEGPLTKNDNAQEIAARFIPCLLYTSDAADEEDSVDLGGRRIT